MNQTERQLDVNNKIHDQFKQLEKVLNKMRKIYDNSQKQEGDEFTWDFLKKLGSIHNIVKINDILIENFNMNIIE